MDLDYMLGKVKHQGKINQSPQHVDGWDQLNRKSTIENQWCQLIHESINVQGNPQTKNWY